jgi:hypothetical protein
MYLEDAEDPCWSGYRQIGMKRKKSKKVPNCVPEDLQIGDMFIVDNPEVKLSALKGQSINDTHSNKCI